MLRLYEHEDLEGWALVAYQMAQEAHDDYFSSRRGVWLLEDLGVVCIYSNCPYAGHADLRDEETAMIRALLREAGISELAYATYPPKGRAAAGYSYAMLLDTDEVLIVTGIVQKAILKSFEKINGGKKKTLDTAESAQSHELSPEVNSGVPVMPTDPQMPPITNENGGPAATLHPAETGKPDRQPGRINVREGGGAGEPA